MVPIKVSAVAIRTVLLLLPMAGVHPSRSTLLTKANGRRLPPLCCSERQLWQLRFLPPHSIGSARDCRRPMIPCFVVSSVLVSASAVAAQSLTTRRTPYVDFISLHVQYFRQPTTENRCRAVDCPVFVRTRVQFYPIQIFFLFVFTRFSLFLSRTTSPDCRCIRPCFTISRCSAGRHFFFFLSFAHRISRLLIE